MEPRAGLTRTSTQIAGAGFLRNQRGLEKDWRNGELTVAFWLPERTAQLTCSLTDQPPGPMYLVDDLQAWISQHPQLQVSVAKEEIPSGSVDQPDA